MTIRDRVIHTGNIALAGDSFRFAEPGAWVRAPTSLPVHPNAVRRNAAGQSCHRGRFSLSRFYVNLRVAKKRPRCHVLMIGGGCVYSINTRGSYRGQFPAFLQHRFKTVNDIIQPLDKAVKNDILHNRWGCSLNSFSFTVFVRRAGI